MDKIILPLGSLYADRYIAYPPSVTCIGSEADAATFCRLHSLTVSCRLDCGDRTRWGVSGRWSGREFWFTCYAPTLIDAVLDWCGHEAEGSTWRDFFALRWARARLLFAKWRKPGTVILGGYRVEWIIGWTESDLRQNGVLAGMTENTPSREAEIADNRVHDIDDPAITSEVSVPASLDDINVLFHEPINIPGVLGVTQNFETGETSIRCEPGAVEDVRRAIREVQDRGEVGWRL